MRKVWVVVANSSTAKIYQAENVKKLVSVRDFKHVESQMQERDLISDRPGRAKSAIPHTMEEKTPQKVKERNHFAHEIASFIEEGLKKNAFERLYLIAASPFLGFLREAFSPHITKLIHQEINKDLTQSKPEEILDYLPPVL